MLRHKHLAYLLGLATLCLSGSLPTPVSLIAEAEARPAARAAHRHVRQPARRTTVHHHARRTVVVAPVRPVPVVRPPYWGRVVAGVTLGTVVGVAVANSVPKAPASTLCWFWSDTTQTRGYWDYCTPPVQ